MRLRPATEAEIDRWDELVVANPDGGHYMQTKTWAEFKRKHHWEPHYFIFEARDTQIAAVFMSRAAAGFGKIWYVPKGPGVATDQQLAAVAKAVKVYGFNGLMVKFEPELNEDLIKPATLIKAGLNPSKRNTQFKATVIVNLEPSEDEILASFKQKTRYNIRLAARRGVTVEPVPSTDANIDAFYKLLAATQARAGYFLRSLEYTREYIKGLSEAGQGQLFFASFEGQLLAGIFVIQVGSKSWYKDGGSIREHSNVMAPYLLQWEAMKWLKAKEVDSYDMVGVPPRKLMNPDHILYSLYQFKSGFEPEVTEFIGAWDIPLSSKYKLWAAGGERAISAYHSKIHHDYFY